MPVEKTRVPLLANAVEIGPFILQSLIFGNEDQGTGNNSPTEMFEKFIYSAQHLLEHLR